MKKKIQYIKSIDLEIMYKKSYPDIDKIIWNKPATIVFLKTGEKGICKVQPGDKWNRELGFWVAYAKALQEGPQLFSVAVEGIFNIPTSTVTIYKSQYNNIKNIIAQGQGPGSFDWESTNVYKDVICAPIVYHQLAPRKARAILELFGILSDFGINVNTITEKIFNTYIETPDKTK